MAKTDPKDDRIAELELQLEAANKATTAAELAAQELPGLRSELEKLQDSLKTRDSRILSLEGEVRQLREAAGDKPRSTVTIDPAKGVQLSVSSLVTNVITGQPVTAIAGDVIVVKEEFDAMSTKLGTKVKVHPVSKDEIEAAKKAGRAY